MGLHLTGIYAYANTLFPLSLKKRHAQPRKRCEELCRRRFRFLLRPVKLQLRDSGGSRKLPGTWSRKSNNNSDLPALSAYYFFVLVFAFQFDNFSLGSFYFVFASSFSPPPLPDGDRNPSGHFFLFFFEAGSYSTFLLLCCSFQ